MKKTRTTLLAPFFSSMAFLSFKKKGEDEETENVSPAMSELSLKGGNLSLSDLDGGMGGLGDIKLDDISTDSLDDEFQQKTGSRQDEKKLQEIEATINDLKKDSESFDLANRSINGEIDSLKEELSRINDSIRELLNIYEAVSRQYNPFVNNDPSGQMISEGDLFDGGELSMDAEKSNDTAWNEPQETEWSVEDSPFDEDGPLDHIVRPEPDSGETVSSGVEEPLTDDATEPISERPEYGIQPLDASEQHAESSSGEDAYAFGHVYKLIEHQIGKIYRKRLNGDEVSVADIQALDLWMSEFRRLGGI